MANYHGGKDSLYEILGVYRSSSTKDIERAYRRLKAEAEKDAAAPEELTLLREAHEVLSDPQKRAHYDASLRSDEFLRPEGPKAGPAVKWAPIFAVVVVVLVGLWFLFRPGGESDRIPEEIFAAAVPSVGRVNVIDIRGRATPHDNAFAIDPGVMLTTCQGFRANTQVVVKFGARTASATVSRADAKRNLCRLAVVGGGSWPLGINASGPQARDRAYTAHVNPQGETQLLKTRVRGFIDADGARLIELTEPVDPSQNGGALIDTRGRVIGVLTTLHGFPGKHVALPATWIEELRRAPVK